MTLQTIEKQTFDLDFAIRKGLLKETDRPAAGCFLCYLNDEGHDVTDPEGWKAQAEATVKTSKCVSNDEDWDPNQ